MTDRSCFSPFIHTLGLGSPGVLCLYMLGDCPLGARPRMQEVSFGQEFRFMCIPHVLDALGFLPLSGECFALRLKYKP